MDLGLLEGVQSHYSHPPWCTWSPGMKRVSFSTTSRSAAPAFRMERVRPPGPGPTSQTWAPFKLPACRTILSATIDETHGISFFALQILIGLLQRHQLVNWISVHVAHASKQLVHVLRSEVLIKRLWGLYLDECRLPFQRLSASAQ